MNQNKMMAAFLAQNPEQTQAICELVNEQQRGHKAIAESIEQAAYPLRALTPQDLLRNVEQKGPQALLDLFAMLHTQHVEITHRIGTMRGNIGALLNHPKVAAILPEVIEELENGDPENEAVANEESAMQLHEGRLVGRMKADGTVERYPEGDGEEE